MLKLLPILSLAQIAAPTALPVEIPAPPVAPRFQYVVQQHEVRQLPGQLDSVPVFNSNSPEMVQKEGILLSTFPPDGMRVPSAHLNQPLEGRFDIFAHHIARGVDLSDFRTLYIGILIHNPGSRPVALNVLQAVSYLSQEAPFYNLPAYVVNPDGSVFAGPGSRTTTDILRGLNQPFLPRQISLPPGRTQLLLSAPIPLRSLEAFRSGAPLPQYDVGQTGLDVAEIAFQPDGQVGLPPTANPVPPPPTHREIPINGRTALMYMQSDGPVHVASLAMYGRVMPGGVERAPSLEEWQALLTQGDLAGPRDRPPTPPNTRNLGRFYYGRVAGVAQGSEWQAELTDSPQVDYLSIPQPGRAVSYAISTVDNNTLGTGQIQSAPMIARYPDTAYRAHGNYGVRYHLRLPLYNNTDRAQTVSVLFQTPMKDESLRGQGLRFIDPPDQRIFFRGTLRLRYENDWGVTQTRYVHVIQRRGERGEPLLSLQLPRGSRRVVEVDFLYPPDATPPQVLTVQTETESRAPGYTNTLHSTPQGPSASALE